MTEHVVHTYMVEPGVRVGCPLCAQRPTVVDRLANGMFRVSPCGHRVDRITDVEHAS